MLPQKTERMIHMDMKTAIDVSRRRLPVVHNGTTYERITARITRIDERGGESHSLELLDYCGSAVMIAALGEVEVKEDNNNG